MTSIRIVDLETTGMSETDEVVEIGAVDVGVISRNVTPVGADLVKPDRLIPPEASAVHHLTDEDVIDARRWADVWPGYMAGHDDVIAFAAHKASFEAQWLNEERRGGKPLICTWKCAMRKWPDAPGFGNQVLRYWLKLRLGAEALPPHRALTDALVTGHILVDLLRTEPVERLIQWSGEPAAYPRLLIGKHKGQTWSEPPSDYLDWLAEGKHDLDADWRWNAKREIQRRAEAKAAVLAERRTAYAKLAKAAVITAITADDMASWWEAERGRRDELGIIAGTPEYVAIADVCVAHKTKLLGAPRTQQGSTSVGGAEPR